MSSGRFFTSFSVGRITIAVIGPEGAEADMGLEEAMLGEEEHGRPVHEHGKQQAGDASD